MAVVLPAVDGPWSSSAGPFLSLSAAVGNVLCFPTNSPLRECRKLLTFFGMFSYTPDGHQVSLYYAEIAQLGECQTKALKVPGSTLGVGSIGPVFWGHMVRNAGPVCHYIPYEVPLEPKCFSIGCLFTKWMTGRRHCPQGVAT